MIHNHINKLFHSPISVSSCFISTNPGNCDLFCSLHLFIYLSPLKIYAWLGKFQIVGEERDLEMWQSIKRTVKVKGKAQSGGRKQQRWEKQHENVQERRVLDSLVSKSINDGKQ